MRSQSEPLKMAIAMAQTYKVTLTGFPGRLVVSNTGEVKQFIAVRTGAGGKSFLCINQTQSAGISMNLWTATVHKIAFVIHLW